MEQTENEEKNSDDFADIKSLLTFIMIFLLLDSLIFGGFFVFIFLTGVR